MAAAEPSVVLLEIDAVRVHSIELESHPPRTADPDRVAGGLEALQGMELVPRQVHVPRLLGRIQGVES